MKPPMTTFPWDSTPMFTPTWREIAEKAKNYATARVRATGQYVKLVSIARLADGLELVEPAFVCRAAGQAGTELRTTEELCGFCL